MTNKLQEYSTYQPPGTTGKHPKALSDRVKDFWNYVNKDPSNPHGCWDWMLSIKSCGYGQFNVDGTNWSSHRFAYAVTYGDIPDGVCVCHKCDNRKCCNPEHLFLGTKGDNMVDMIAKGREKHASGDSCPASKLNSEQVAVIRSLFTFCKMRLATIARAYGIRRTTVGQIVKNRTWTGVKPLLASDPRVSKMRHRIECGEFNTHRPSQFGERHSQHKLTDDAVREIRVEYRRGNVKQLAAKFGVSIASIRDVAYGRRWTHVK